ncbi:hypothetical protein MJO28_016435 [Puccinia striiformis f. sp. tritici]|uniref:Nuclear transport factor 2 n=3 Tax=Puccinia striiformis TaxID=27350 RepID=A0A2S4VVM5_9BASI|nr:hypothetical protein MJO29_016199 [Puccinia striiformis f. sp. tritici]KAI7935564.1 hypothetical protein MJO28_016435 [Puccinia striiformis f. sp. tritici]POW13517.1 hypothetical protein PSTT_03650 [Puccinia striiformis]
MEVAVNFSAVPVLRAFWLISGPVGRLELTETHQDPPPRPYRQPPVSLQVSAPAAVSASEETLKASPIGSDLSTLISIDSSTLDRQSLSLYRLRKMSDPTQIASQFVQFYYEKFDTDRGQLAPLYRDHSMLTFEANPYLGTANIVKKLQELPFAKVTHQVHTLDAQPSNSATPSIIVLVTGALQIDGETNPLRFSQAFHLVSEDGSFFVLNDVFRLVYG